MKRISVLLYPLCVIALLLYVMCMLCEAYSSQYLLTVSDGH